MTFIVTTEYELNKIAAPNMPLATEVYSQQYQDQLNNVLRLYFNRLDNLIGQLTASDSWAISLPNGAFHQDGATALTGAMTNVSTTPIQVTSTTGFASAGTLLIADELVGYTGKTSTTFTGITRGIYGTTNVAHIVGVAVTEALGTASSTSSIAIPFTNTDASNLVVLDGTHTSRIVFEEVGRYNVQFSAQLLNLTSSEDEVTFWFKQDGNDIAFSAGVIQMQKQTGSGPGAAIASWNIFVDITAANQYVELYYASKTGNTVVATYPAGTAPVTPVSPSVILTATFVSKI